MNWRIIAAVVVAFIVGAAAGALAEHAHVESDKTNSSAAPTTTVPTADWFGTQKSAACPTLAKWYTAIGKASYLAPSKGSWTTIRAQLLQQDSSISAAYQALLSNANALGQPEIQALAAYQGRASAALQSASSAAAYSASLKALGSPQVDNAAGVLAQTAKSCAKG